MEKIYIKYYKQYYNENSYLLFAFVSKRLIKLIKKKVLQHTWIYPYWEIKNLSFDCSINAEQHTGKLISAKGLILFTKDKEQP